MKKYFLFIILLTWFANETLVAQDCEITVEHNAGNAIIIDPESNTENYSAGGWVSYSQEHITQIENTGRNDLLVRTRHSNGNIDEYHTINNGNQTIWFPLPNFAGTSLHQVRCLSYATIHDTEDLIAEFGGSAQNLISDAQSAAEQGAQDAKESMMELINTANYETFQEEVEQSRQQAEDKWEELQQLAAEGNEIGDLILSEHFPELHEAIQATGSISVNIPAAALKTHEQNLENLQAKLQEMDQKYEVSSNINAFANINLEDQFPEIYEIENYQCSIDTGLFEQFDGEFNRFFTAFSQLMNEIIPESDLPVFQFTGSETDQLKGLLEKPPCFNEVAEANKLILEDLNEFHAFVTSIHENLGQWEAKWFAQGNESVYEESQRLAQSSARLIQLIIRQRQLEHETTQAKTEMDESYEQLQYGYGRSQNLSAEAMTDHIIDVVMNPRDSEKIQQDLDDHQAAVERYERALNARERGWGNLQRAAVDWTNGIASLASSVSRLRLDFRLITDFEGLMNNPVTLNFPEKSLRLAKSCVNSVNKDIGTVIQIFDNAFRRYLADLRSKMQLAIPDEFYTALKVQFKVISKIHAADAKELADFILTASKLARSYALITVTYADLGQSLAQNPTDPGYLPNVESKVKNLSDRAERLSTDHSDFNQALANTGPNIDALFEAVVELKVSLEANRSDLPALAARLLDTSVSLESMLNGMDDLAQSAGNCAAGKLDLVEKAISTFPQRSKAFMDLIAEMSLDTVPDEVKQSISNLLQLTNEQISNYADLRSWEVIEEEITNEQTIVMATAFAPLDFVQFHNEFLLALLPVPQPDAMPKLEILVQSFDDLVIETQELRSVILEIVETDQQALHELQSLIDWARTQETEIVNDIGELQLIVFNGAPILSEIDEMQDVAGLWAVAAIETPGRLEELTISEIAQYLEELRPQVEQALQNLYSQTAAAISCADDAIQSHATLANQSVSTAASQAIASISTTAPTVYNNLQNLLNPTSGLLNSVEQVITAGQNLLQEVQQSASAGQSAFENMASGSFQQIQDAVSCVDTRSQTIQQVTEELWNYYSEIEGDQFQQMEFIQTNINFNLNN